MSIRLEGLIRYEAITVKIYSNENNCKYDTGLPGV